jgi:hypothetical protein
MRGRVAARLCVLAGFLGCAGLSSSATIGTSSWLQVNLSWMPFSYYDTSHLASQYGTFTASCPSGSSVRGCFQTVLGNMAAQYVSGVRIIVSLCDANSLAFNNCGQSYTSISWNPTANPYQQTWINNAKNFFTDVHNAGIPNVTISIASASPVSQPVSAASSPKGACSDGVSCCLDTYNSTTINFSPTDPFGTSPLDGTPLGNFWTPATKHSNNGYNCNPINPYFIGWNNEFNVIGAMLQAARGLVTVYELETQQELNFAAFTVLARYMYDNTSPQSAGLSTGQIVDVVSNLRSLMSANGFDPGRVNWSSTGSESTSATYDGCTNIYTDYGRNLGPDEMAQAITGGHIGLNSDFVSIEGLQCNGSNLGSMFSVPDYSTQPDIIDVHIYSQATGTTNTDTQIQEAAASDFGALPHFLILASDTAADVVIGETWGGTLSPAQPGGTYCWLAGGYQAPSGAPADNVAGFNNEGVSSPLSAYTVTFRPWMELEDSSGQCFAYGGGPGSPSNYQSVNYQNAGPYTPTNR